MNKKLSGSDEKGGVKINSYRPVSAICWILFAFGLLIQVFSPHLRIEHHAFVAPPGLLAAGTVISPAALVAKERIVQSISALLTVVGTFGLGWCHWDRLLKRG